MFDARLRKMMADETIVFCCVDGEWGFLRTADYERRFGFLGLVTAERAVAVLEESESWR